MAGHNVGADVSLQYSKSGTRENVGINDNVYHGHQSIQYSEQMEPSVKQSFKPSLQVKSQNVTSKPMTQEFNPSPHSLDKMRLKSSALSIREEETSQA